MAANIRRHLESRSLNTKEFADIMNFKYTTVLDWVNANTYPRIDKIEQMANYFNVDKSDLVEEYHEVNHFVSRISATASKLVAFRQEKVFNFAEKQLREQESLHKIHEPQVIYLTVTAHGFQSAGDGYFQDSDVAVDIQVPQNQIPDDYDDASIVIGDSMSPKLKDGDLLFVKYTPQVEIGQIGVFRTTKGNFVKRLQPDRLESLNPAYDDIYFTEDEEADAIGVVIDYYRKDV